MEIPKAFDRLAASFLCTLEEEVWSLPKSERSATNQTRFFLVPLPIYATLRGSPTGQCSQEIFSILGIDVFVSSKLSFSEAQYIMLEVAVSTTKSGQKWLEMWSSKLNLKCYNLTNPPTCASSFRSSWLFASAEQVVKKRNWSKSGRIDNDFTVVLEHIHHLWNLCWIIDHPLDGKSSNAFPPAVCLPGHS